MDGFVVISAEALGELVSAAVREGLQAAGGAAPATAADPGTGIAPAKLYTAAEVAEALSFSRPQSVHEIAEAELPRRRVGAKGGRTLFLGHDLLRYALGLPPADPHDVYRSLTAAPSSPPSPTLPPVKQTSRRDSRSRRRVL